MRRTDRRAYLRAVAAGTVTALAGCSGLVLDWSDGGDGESAPSGSTEGEAGTATDGGGEVDGPPLTGRWSTVGADAARTGHAADETGPAGSPAVEWRTERRNGGFRFHAPVVADGTVIAGSADGSVYAVGPDGGEDWTADLGSPVADGIAYVGDLGGTLYALGAADGEERWRRSFVDWIDEQVAVADGRAIVGGAGVHSLV